MLRLTVAPDMGAPVEALTTVPTILELCANPGNTAARSTIRNSLSLIRCY